MFTPCSYISYIYIYPCYISSLNAKKQYICKINVTTLHIICHNLSFQLITVPPTTVWKQMLPSGTSGLGKSPLIVSDVSYQIHQNIPCWNYFIAQNTLSFSSLPSPDVNDNVPFFTSSIYEASVTEGAETGTLVVQVSANDLDLGLNGKVTTDVHTQTHTLWWKWCFALSASSQLNLVSCEYSRCSLLC